MAIMIQVSELSLSNAEGRKIFKDLHFRLNRGEWGCILGRSQPSRTLFLQLLTGECRPDQGQILVDERNILRINPEKLRGLRRRLGILPKNPAPLGDRTLLESLVLRLKALDVPGRDARERAAQALELVGLQEQARQLPKLLGELDKQLFALALALSYDPVLLLLDDPLLALSAHKDQEKFLEILEKIHLRKRLTTLMTSEKMSFSNKFPILLFDLLEGQLRERQPLSPLSELEEVR